MKTLISKIKPGDKIRLSGGEIVTAACEPVLVITQEFHIETAEGVPVDEIAGLADDEFEIVESEEKWPEEIACL